MTRDEQEAKLAALLDTAVEVQQEQALTLEQLLDGTFPLGHVWPGACYLSPKMKDLKNVWGAMEAVERIEVDSIPAAIEVLDKYAAIVQMLVRVPGEEGWRVPTIDEVQERFDLEECRDLVARMLRKDGFDIPEKGEDRGNG